MLRRAVSLILLLWALGFIVFAVSLPKPMGKGASGAIVVLTGGEGRIDRGLALLRGKAAGRMLVAGVDPEVKPREFAAHYHVDAALMTCCITLGYQSVDTRSNAAEVADWVRENKLASIRLVTSDWHMRRAAWELAQRLPPTVTVETDAVTTKPTFNTLLLEYNKLIARRMVHLWGR
ncbi:MAG: hypothetical protein RLY97_695 [Pseudomonadota bacterium]|jgi:uncharacterized SAM-binding protein YcdF (DUF218 family)